MTERPNALGRDPNRERGVEVRAEIVAGVTATAVFVALLIAVRSADGPLAVDRTLLQFVESHRAGWLTALARSVTQLGSGWIVTPLVVLAAGFLARRSRIRDAIVIAASSAGCALLVATIKPAVGRPRPPAAGQLVRAVGAAFPSGHSTQSVACYGAIALVLIAGAASRRVKRWAAWSALCIAMGIGWSRVYLGVHWPTDVVGGWTLAIAWLALVALLARRRGEHAPLRATSSRDDRL